MGLGDIYDIGYSTCLEIDTAATVNFNISQTISFQSIPVLTLEEVVVK